MNQTIRMAALGLAWPILLASCGGGGSDVAPPQEPTPPPPPPPITQQQRIDAATATANNNDACGKTIGPFYWEVGDVNGAKAAGAAGDGSVTSTTEMKYYSASKWIYASYVLQRRGVANLAADGPYLNFTAGYTNFGVNPFDPNCQSLTLGQCLQAKPGLDVQDPAKIGVFDYDDGHMQQHANAVMGLGGDDSAALAVDVQAQIGNFGFSYWTPEPAAGVQGTPLAYASFLRAMLGGQLTIGGTLGNPAYSSYKVCTNSADGTCPKAAPPGPDDSGRDSPSSQEDWSYFLGSWVEDDPTVGDHAFASVGGGGFYPWIDKTKTYYGMVARQITALDLEASAGFHSAQCGRLIRQAYVTGVQVTATVPTP